MRSFRFAAAAAAFAAAAAWAWVAPPFTGSAQVDENVIACRVLHQRAQQSRNWPEVISYKNAYDFVKQHVRDGRSIEQQEKYFSELARTNGGGSYACMYLNRAPKANCGFRNHETQALVEAIEKKMKDDNLTVEDITKAVQTAQPARDTKKYTP